MTGRLYIVRIPLVLSELARFSHERNRGAIRQRRRDGREAEADFDEGRALHHLLDETFGPASLRPFRLMVAPGKVRGSIYAYTKTPKGDLLDTARATGPPEAARILTLDRLDTNDLPPRLWMTGRRLGFDIRVRPIMRLKSELATGRDPTRPYKRGQEVDVYFLEGRRRFPDEPRRVADGETIASGMANADCSREAVYRDWLAARMGSAVELVAERTKLAHFRRTRVARLGHAPEGPDAVLQGELVIRDPDAFPGLLEKGIGRHKAYGYGMLLLRPARRAEG